MNTEELIIESCIADAEENPTDEEKEESEKADLEVQDWRDSQGQY